MLLILIGILISSIYSFYILPKNEGSTPSINPTIYPFLYKGMVIIPYNRKNAIHLHHWMIYLFIIIISIIYDIPQIITGFSIGLLLQGISYKDRFNFIRSNPYNNI